MIEKIVIATHNPAKKERYGRLLSSLAETVLNLDDLGIIDKPIESGSTAEENAEIKARFYAQKSGLPVFSEDEALYVDFLPLDRQPGVHVRRIDGKDEVDDEALINYWEGTIKDAPSDKRSGKWHFAYCLYFPGGEIKIFTIDRPILFFSPSSEKRIPGWPMSSLQGPLKFNKPHTELTNEEKNINNQTVNDLISKELKNL